ncbi:phasin family protein [Pontibacterium sp. N1Y112]|uniref:Phasin family protein n=1 Tax=Pontibacterium sinense TaxID=2781979 RepID=A0A8J7KB18_9GAMM|nr:phasin family protein [Pontibacterium sinense]MBE9398686.1 phasin family protein [Pontibacterium sinense]MCO4759388.1 phasin family protein [Oceanospirillaceae bacterium]
MFQDMNKAFSQSMEPFKDLVNIQTKMLEELTRQQMACTKSCIEATIQQTKEMQNCQSPTELMELQKTYAKKLEDTLKDASEHNLQALGEARSEMERLTQDTFDAFASKK